MTKRHSLIAGLLISGALTAFAAQPASATVIADLQLTNMTFSDVSWISGNTPSIADKGAVVDTSNAGSVTAEPLTYNFNFTATGNAGDVVPPDPLFVVEPNGSGAGTIAVTFDFSYNNGSSTQSLALLEDVNYYAQTPDTDTLLWQQGTNGACVGSQTTYHSGDECTYTFALNGANFSIMMDDETDWDMAEFDGATVDLAVTRVPESASIAMFGAGLLGLGMLWRRRRQGRTATAI